MKVLFLNDLEDLIADVQHFYSERTDEDEIDHNLTKGCNYLPLGSGNLDED